MADRKKLALAYHRKLRGKITIELKEKLRSESELNLAYTPGVAEPCRAIAQNSDRAYDLTWKANTILIVTDGSAVLGLGDIGPEAALPVMEGKSLLFKKFGGVDCVPICLATQNPQEIVEIVEKIAPAYGGINLEDISAPRCFAIEDALKKRLKIPVFHDDQHGTAIVVLAGLLNALKVVGKKMAEVRVVVNGAGAAGIAIARILKKAGVRKLVLVDSRGVCFVGRAKMNPQKTAVAKSFGVGRDADAAGGKLADAICDADVFIGVSQPNLVSEKMARSMRPGAIIFALSNPDPEILPAVAKKAGIAVIATGRSDFPNQINNVLAFPGIFRGALDCRCQITEKIKLAAAHAIADCVPRPTATKIVPSAFDKTVAQEVAKAVKSTAVKR